MIWHFYGNNEKVIMTDNPYQNQLQRTATSISSAEMNTDDDDDEYWIESEHAISKKPYITSNTQSLFLNFNSDLCLQKAKKKRTPINSKLATKSKKQPAAIKVNGVNILNRKNLDSKIVVERIQKRRENHNHVERRRRDCINDTIYKLSQAIPNASTSEVGQQKINKYNVLKSALDHILHLQSENASIKQQLKSFQRPVESSPSYSVGNTSYYIPDLRGPQQKQHDYYHHLAELRAGNSFHMP